MIAADAIGRMHPDWEVDVCPIADGGEGFAAILTGAVGGKTHAACVRGPRGVRLKASFGIVSADRIPPGCRPLVFGNDDPDRAQRVGVLEMAAASGLSHLGVHERDPFQTTSYGTGELIAHVARMKVDRVLLGVGGSATHDLGLGALHALGFTFHDTSGNDLGIPIPAVWHRIAAIAGALEPTLPPIIVSSDVDSPLLGSSGAVAVYGRQKGMRAELQPLLEWQSERIARMLCRHLGRPRALADVPGAGAAGGLSFGLVAAGKAKIVSGSQLVAGWLALEQRLERADLLITGEGCFDQSSMVGKAPGMLLQRAIALRKEAFVFAGRVQSSLSCNLPLYEITPAKTPENTAFREAAKNLSLKITKVLRR